MPNDDKVYIKIYEFENETIIAACDPEVLDKILVDLSRKIRFHVDPNYFKGDLRDIQYLLDHLKIASNATLVGRKVVEAALQAGYIHPEAILHVEDVPIALFTRV
ncbi:MAG: DUF424 family protein [Desulfurococcaceae archaeon]